MKSSQWCLEERQPSTNVSLEFAGVGTVICFFHKVPERYGVSKNHSALLVVVLRKEKERGVWT